MRRRRLLFLCGAWTLSALGCLTLVFAYLAGVRYDAVPVPHALLRVPGVGHLIDAARFGPLVRFVDAQLDEQSRDAFESVWDTTSPVLLSRTLYRRVDMFGAQKYMYKAGLKKLSVWASEGRGSIGFETEDTVERRRALEGIRFAHLVAASYDRDGFRRVDPPATGPCEASVLFLGDSFTDGMWVGDADTFVSQYTRVASERSGRRVCATNTGVNGYGSLEEAYILEHYFEEIGRPRLVLLMYFANDVDDDYDAVVGGRLPDAPAKWEQSLAYVRRIARFTQEHGATLAVAAIPPAGQLEHPDRRHYQAILQAFCAVEHVPFIDLLDDLRGSGEKDLYWQWDPHLTPRGHRVLAEALYEKTRVIVYGLLSRS
jgi:lysophospholipase L1-like esterase